MSTIGGGTPIDTSLLQTAQAQQAASKARDKEKASERGRRFQDLVDLRVAGVESDDAVRKLPSNDSEQAEAEHQAQSQPERLPDTDEDERPRIDVQA
jgi:hypothetical protein